FAAPPTTAPTQTPPLASAASDHSLCMPCLPPNSFTQTSEPSDLYFARNANWSAVGFTVPAPKSTCPYSEPATKISPAAFVATACAMPPPSVWFHSSGGPASGGAGGGAAASSPTSSPGGGCAPVSPDDDEHAKPNEIEAASEMIENTCRRSMRSPTD